MMRRVAWSVAIAAIVIPMAVMALQPPTGFDETMYHLPLVRAMTEKGIAFHGELRFPVFPLLAELLALPAYWLGGDVATHAIPLLATLLTALVMVAWARARGIRNELLAAAAFLGAPIIVQLATSLYVEAVLTLCVCVGFYCLDRQRFFLAGLCMGAACSTKYLGLYFALAGAIIVWHRARRSLVPYLGGVALIGLPTYVWIFALTGNPFFPFFVANPWNLPLPRPRGVVPFLRLPFDMLFVREKIGWQPPFTPFFAPALLAMAWRARAKFLVPLGYLVASLFLPADARYLVPLLPFVLIEGAAVVDTLRIERWLSIALVVVAIVPGPLYAIHRIVRGGPMERTTYLERNVPEYRALRRAGATRVYSCGGEELMWHAAGTFIGDHVGLNSYNRVLGGDMHAHLTELHIDYLLLVKGKCGHRVPRQGFTLVYEDEAAQLWRVAA